MKVLIAALALATACEQGVAWQASAVPLRIGVNSGNNVFGQGVRANATIGRAIRLILMNVGGGWPGRGDMATQGSPAKYAYAIAEREDVAVLKAATSFFVGELDPRNR